MQYSLHLEFSNPQREYFKHVPNDKKYGISSYDKRKNKVCEKCHYVHLVHCPINDLHSDVTKRKKRKFMNKNQSESNSSSHHYSYDNEDVVCDKKYFDNNEEIKIEVFHVQPSSITGTENLLSTKMPEVICSNCYFEMRSRQVSDQNKRKSDNICSQVVKLVHIGNFKTYLCQSCVVSLDKVLANLEKQVQQIHGNMTPDDVNNFFHQEVKGKCPEYRKCQSYNEQRVQSVNNYSMSNSCEKLENIKNYASRKRLRSDASFKKDYDDYNLFVDDIMNADCYGNQNDFSIKPELAFDNFGFRTRIIKENISDKSFTLAANRKVSRRSVSITSSDSYDDYEPDVVHKPNIERFPFDKFAYKRSLYNSLNKGLNNRNVPNKHISLKVDSDIAKKSSATFSRVANDDDFDVDLFLNTNDEILHELQKTSENYKRILNADITSPPDVVTNSSIMLNDIVHDKKEFLSERLLNGQRLNEREKISSPSPANKYILKVKEESELLSPDYFNSNVKCTPEIESLLNHSVQRSTHEESIFEANGTLRRKVEHKSNGNDGDSITELEQPFVTSLLTNTNEVLKDIIPQIKEENLSIKEEQFDAVLENTRKYSKPICNDVCHARVLDINTIKPEIKEEQPDFHCLENKENATNWDAAIKTEIPDSTHYENINYSWHSAWDELL